MLRPSSWPFLLTAIIVIAFAAACDDGDDGAASTATPRPSTASPVATMSPVPDVRSLDLANEPEVRDFADELDGEVTPEEIIYADLSGDGLEEAVVPISSGGTQGVLGFVVVGYVNGDLAVLLSGAPEEGLRIAVTDEQLVTTLPVYSEGDTPGFPSNVKNVYYAWKGDHFAIDREETVESPNAPPRP